MSIHSLLDHGFVQLPPNDTAPKHELDKGPKCRLGTKDFYSYRAACAAARASGIPAYEIKWLRDEGDLR